MPTDYHHPNLRASLLAEGRSLLISEGYAHFSLRKLAQGLGVSHNAPYRHFASREELILAIVREDQARFDAALAAGIEGVADPEERLYRLGEAYVGFFLDNPEVLLLFQILSERIGFQGEAIVSLFTGTACAEAREGGSGERDGYALLAEAARPLAPRFPGLSEGEILLGFWAKVHGLASLLVSKPEYLPAEGRRERVARLVRTAF
ncbi:MAG TPA: TetR/AcrR family transcriptional regulator [Spirochaetales bacterium]|nr:TetR/AcrR family transcriptional regulator [Spirochaetales bacterium]HRY53801.1 TetR/AcrR family transcriptional regulator [Spirochaetia bacterium]HRZ64640.1 TetR/AcrR family transcriptional regulator [Spirochaetia bacterium]